jgi:hypothetical protein
MVSCIDRRYSRSDYHRHDLALFPVVGSSCCCHVSAVELETACPSAASEKGALASHSPSSGGSKPTRLLKANNFLQWMMDTGVGEEQQPEKLAHRQLIPIFAGVNTTTRAGVNAIYDLCARSGYFEPLRDEIGRVLREDVGWGHRRSSRCVRWIVFYKILGD